MKAAKQQPAAKEVSFAVTRGEKKIISKIADRAWAVFKKNKIRGTDRTSLEMDVTAVHANGCPLRLVDLLEADEFNFAHDIFGIDRHLDRETGQLLNCFRPRFCERKAA